MPTGGEKSDSKEFADLLDVGSDRQLRAVVADKGYDSKANRVLARSRGIRAHLRQLKRFKRVAFRREKPSQNVESFVALACGFIILKSVHTP